MATSHQFKALAAVAMLTISLVLLGSTRDAGYAIARAFECRSSTARISELTPHAVTYAKPRLYETVR